MTQLKDLANFTLNGKPVENPFEFEESGEVDPNALKQLKSKKLPTMYISANPTSSGDWAKYYLNH